MKPGDLLTWTCAGVHPAAMGTAYMNVGDSFLTKPEFNWSMRNVHSDEDCVDLPIDWPWLLIAITDDIMTCLISKPDGNVQLCRISTFADDVISFGKPMYLAYPRPL